ncbi:hypothetical protein KC357_g35 [Hortaea werneckii]|nr:hypothetical protein KC357_g35 [Hortaea werneckii]
MLGQLNLAATKGREVDVGNLELLCWFTHLDGVVLYGPPPAHLPRQNLPSTSLDPSPHFIFLTERLTLPPTSQLPRIERVLLAAASSPAVQGPRKPCPSSSTAAQNIGENQRKKQPFCRGSVFPYSSRREE